jgi:L-aminopeptidase/D-esterase-like protein
MITEVDGVLVGHWTDADARTGCTVVVFPEGTVASGEIRGGAPATREFALLAPERLVATVDAVVLSGGSAFGLAACDGVVEWLEANHRGFPTAFGPVPIVVGMSLFDLGVGDSSVRPRAADGHHAAQVASSSSPQHGPVGAGAGATVDKWQGGPARDAGLGTAVHRDGELVVGALVAVNAAGAVDHGVTLDAIRRGDARPVRTGSPFANTTLGVVVTNAALDKVGCHLVAQAAHDGLARAVTPSHLLTDGDAIVAAATGAVDADLDWVRTVAQLVVADAIESAVTTPGGQ